MKNSKTRATSKQKTTKKVTYGSMVKIDTCFSQSQTAKSQKPFRLEPQIKEENKQQNFQAEQMKNIRQKILLNNVNKNLRALVALKTRPQKVKIYQEWQNKDDDQPTNTVVDHQTVNEAIKLLYPFMSWFSLFQGILVIMFLWLVSVAIVFQEKIGTILYLFIAGSITLYILLEILLMIKDQVLNNFSFGSKLYQLSNPLILILGNILMIIRNMSDIVQINITIQISIVLVFLNVIQAMPNYFQWLLMIAEKKKIIKQLRIIEAFCMLFGLAHLFGLFIYSSKYVSPQGKKTWLGEAGLQDQTWFIKYIYSVYWAITTTVTVGYGDLTPKNHIQVMMIMVVQVVGTSYFGYMINVIGIAVFKINKKNEQYDNFQQTISKLQDHYQLTDQLCYEMKRDVKQKYNQSHKVVSLKNNEQSQFLQYIDSTVKKSFIHQTNIRIIKKSLFFLTYFTVDCQNHIALKLIRIIYKKDEKIITKNQKNNERNMVIVNNGKVRMFIQKIQNNLLKKKMVKTIQPIEGEPTLNVIGYSSLILDRDMELSAQADVMTSGYVLKRSDLLQAVQKSMIDYQSFHEMRQKMLIINLKQSIQAPTLNQFYYHFTPNKYLLICKNSKKYHQTRSKQQRSDLRRFLFFLDNNKAQKLKRWFSVAILASQKQQFAQVKQNPGKQKLNDFETLLSVESNISNERNRHITMIVQSNRKIQDDIRFDQVKIFEHFMKNHNIDNVSASYEKSCNQRSYKKRIMSKYIKKKDI